MSVTWTSSLCCCSTSLAGGTTSDADQWNASANPGSCSSSASYHLSTSLPAPRMRSHSSRCRSAADACVCSGVAAAAGAAARSVATGRAGTAGAVSGTNGAGSIMAHAPVERGVLGVLVCWCAALFSVYVGRRHGTITLTPAQWQAICGTANCICYLCMMTRYQNFSWPVRQGTLAVWTDRVTADTSAAQAQRPQITATARATWPCMRGTREVEPWPPTRFIRVYFGRVEPDGQDSTWPWIVRPIPIQ